MERLLPDDEPIRCGFSFSPISFLSLYKNALFTAHAVNLGFL